MSSSVQRFLGRRDRKSKVLLPWIQPLHSVATLADCDLQNLPDAGAFGGLFVPDDKKKLEKEDEKRVRTLYHSPIPYTVAYARRVYR
jgi:hypothetical protein